MVLVCNDPRFVFIKTRKTGGTSVEMALQNAADLGEGSVAERTDAILTPRGIVGRRLIPERQATPEGRKWYNHMPASQVRQHLGNSQWDDSTILTAVRNPFARMVSQFHYRRTQSGQALPGDTASIQEAFLTFLRSDAWSDDSELVMIDGKYVVDLAIRLEHLHDDLTVACETLGLGYDGADMPVTKSTKAQRKGLSIAEHYTSAAVAIVQDRMSWVLENYDYPETPN